MENKEAEYWRKYFKEFIQKLKRVKFGGRENGQGRN